MATDMNNAGMAYPLTKMNFLVSIPELAGSMAAFSAATEGLQMGPMGKPEYL